jgi:protein-disulfide isomerase
MKTTSQELSVPVSERDHIRGSASAPVTLVEYGDYQCPHCGSAYESIRAVLNEMGERVRFVYRNFPIITMHPHALRAAEAAEAGGDQSKFWEMHDLLFENQNLDDNELLNDAHRLRLDLNRFDTDLRKHRFMSRIEEDFRGGIRSGVSGTPAFFLNGIRYIGEYDERPLAEAIYEAQE